MSVTVTASKVTYNGDGAQTAFTFSFKIFATTDLDVVITDADGIETTLTITTNYTVAALNNDFSNGGTVTVLAGSIPATGEKITILRDLPITQTFSYTEGGKFPVSDHQDAIDKATLVSQEVDEKRDRALIGPVSDPVGLDMRLPAAANRADEFLFFDTTGKPITAAGGTTAPVSTFMASVLLSADAPAAQNALNGSEETVTGGGTFAILSTMGRVYNPLSGGATAFTLPLASTVYEGWSVVIFGEKAPATIDHHATDSSMDINGFASAWPFFAANDPFAVIATFVGTTGDRNGWDLRAEDGGIIALDLGTLAADSDQSGLFIPGALEIIAAQGASNFKITIPTPTAQRAGAQLTVRHRGTTARTLAIEEATTFFGEDAKSKFCMLPSEARATFIVHSDFYSLIGDAHWGNIYLANNLLSFGVGTEDAAYLSAQDDWFLAADTSASVHFFDCVGRYFDGTSHFEVFKFSIDKTVLTIYGFNLTTLTITPTLTALTKGTATGTHSAVIRVIGQTFE